MLHALIFLLGIITGACIMRGTSRPKVSGILQVVHIDDPDPYLLLELNEDVQEVVKKNSVTLVVNNPHSRD